MSTEPDPSKRGFARRLPILVIALVAVAGTIVLRDTLSFEALRDNHARLMAFRDSHYVPAVLAFIAGYVAIVALSLPGATVATLTGGFLFGLFPGVVFNVASATLGAVLIFLAARRGFGAELAARLDRGGGIARRISAGIHENELSFLFLMRLVPAVPFVLANLVPAFLGVRTGRFAVTTFLGIIPGGLVYTWVGAGLGDVFARDAAPDLGVLFEPQILAPLLALIALAALPMLLRLWRRAR
ncbi:TVP38/TMEM64 family protein [Acidimangrovimonas pyrenivorans]|uniref:TVP38/TMEM64 family membrane protein n=1 Tax=Acidimangrovimonas pyrenivorans TaxID=2030798 RepID=A0ABV7AJ20_9RHOB